MNEGLHHLVKSEQSDKHFDLVLSDSIDDLAVVTNKFYDHLSHIETDVALGVGK